MRSESGFTLIELLTIIGILGVLAALGLSSFAVYRKDAAYSVAEQTLGHGRTCYTAGVNNDDNPPGDVAMTEQSEMGPIQDANAAALLPAMTLPRNVVFKVSYDSTCDHGGCQQGFIEVNHCQGDESVRWMRFGDGVDITLEHIAGAACG